jgi:peptide/nickel transport system permease protein
VSAFLKLLARNRLALGGLIVMGIVVLLAILTPLLPLAPPNVTTRPTGSSRPFPKARSLGTDHLGRDLLSRLLWGTRLSLAVGFAAAIIAATIGAAIGIVAGYYGGRTDNVIMRGVDMLMAFPYILLALAIVAALGPGLMNALIAVAAVNIPFFARNIRGITVGIANKEFVDAAKLAGMSDAKIILTEVLPNVVPVIVIAMSTTVGWMILETAGLSFLGLGSQPPQADLGSMLGEARSALITNPHTSIVPGVMILIIVMAINLLGDGVRDALDPRLKSGALSRPMPATLVPHGPSRTPEEGEDLLALRQPQDAVPRQGPRLQGRRRRRPEPEARRMPRPHRRKRVGQIGHRAQRHGPCRLAARGHHRRARSSTRRGPVGAPYEVLRSLRGRRVAYIFQDPLATLHPLYPSATS